MTQAAKAAVLSLDFNSGLSNFSGGDLSFSDANGFEVTFTDDNSTGSVGGDADGVHITNLNHGNIKVGSPDDFVLGAFNSFSGTVNPHSSGIVALFSQGVESVYFFDTDNDGTHKHLFAFNEIGELIYQSAPGTRQTFFADTTMTTGNSLIYSIEFDTKSGTAGGSFDGTVFTIDDFRVEYSTTSVPEPSTILSSMGIISLATFLHKK
ncbi:MAG: hypothetical protein AAGG51_19595 [Cyanobacteria bacterium P01_G01_bin.54]